MLNPPLRRDVVKLLGVVLVASVIGTGINLARSKPLSLRYSTPAQQELLIPDTAAGGGRAATHGVEPVRSGPLSVIGIDIVKAALQDGSHIIVDARPDLFWEIGHIPGAISLPRADFDSAFPSHESTLRSAIKQGKAIILYCADRHCPDAGKLARMLEQKGFQNLLLFEEGWDAWEKSGLKVEAKS